MNSLIPISRNTFLHILFLLVMGPFSKAQELESSRLEEPILWANSIHLAYGLVPSSLNLLQEVYSLEGIIPSEIRRRIPALLEEYYIQQKSDSTLGFWQFIRSTFKNSEAVNPELFTLEANSPILISGRSGQITYGINDSIFLALYDFLESKEVVLEEWDERFGELLIKYQQLERDLELRQDASSKRALKMLKRGKIEEALELLRERYEFSSRELDRARKEQALAAFDYGNILELRLKYREATIVFKDAAENGSKNSKYINTYCLNLMKVGRYDEVIPMYQKAIQLDLETFGEEDTIVGILYNNLGMAWHTKGYYDKAITYFMKSIKINTINLGKDHPKIATGFSNLGGAWVSKGFLDKALSFYWQAFRIDSLVLGKNHSTVAGDYNNLGYTWEAKGNYDLAIFYFNKALEIDNIIFGENHPKVAKEYNNLGNTWIYKGDYDKAIEYLGNALRIDSLIFGPSHPNIATYYNNIGSAWDAKGYHDRAVDYYYRALAIDTLSLGKTHPAVASDYNNLGLSMNSKGRYDIAIKFFEEALKIDTTIQGKNRLKEAIRYNNLGLSWHGKGNYDRAIEYYNRALKIDLEYLGIDHRKVATRYNNIGEALNEKGMHDQATGYFKKALSILNRLFPEGHPDILAGNQNISRPLSAKGMLFFQNMQYKKALTYFFPALKHARLGIDPPFVITTLNNIGACYKHLGKYDSAILFLDQGIFLAEQFDLDPFLKIPDSISTHPKFIALKKLLKFPFSSKGLLFHKASTLIRMGRKEEGQQIFLKLKEQALKENDLEFLEEIEKDASRGGEE